MSRYFLEIAYKGNNYSGFQSQKNTEKTIQEEVEKAFATLQKEKVIMTGSSRTDAGVHALQNYFHFDYDDKIHPQFVYKMNAILPGDIVAKKITQMPDKVHCRYDAVSREYKYFLYRKKDPFLSDRAFYYPYKIDLDKLQEAALLLTRYKDFTSFSKRRTQVKTFICNIMESKWLQEGDCLAYYVKGDRFLRGMVRALTATMLKVGRDKMSMTEFQGIIEARDCTLASFAAPSQGLFLISVNFDFF